MNFRAKRSVILHLSCLPRNGFESVLRLIEVGFSDMLPFYFGTSIQNFLTLWYKCSRVFDNCFYWLDKSLPPRLCLKCPYWLFLGRGHWGHLFNVQVCRLDSRNSWDCGNSSSHAAVHWIYSITQLGYHRN